MEDREIIDLFFARSEEALRASEEKYGKYCRYIAENILRNKEDTAECVNDALLTLWNKIPPEKPGNLKGYLAKIVRNLALSRYNYNTAKKRNGQIGDISAEFLECMPEQGGSFVDNLAFKELFNKFLAGLNKKTRMIFLRRYFYMASVADIAASMNVSENTVKVTLSRTRKN